MVINARVLRTDGSITTQAVSLPRYRKATNAVVALRTKLRAEDGTVAAIRANETGEHYTWTGHFTADHMAAINAAPKGW